MKPYKRIFINLVLHLLILRVELKILSISIDKKALRQLDDAQKRLGYKSRSKMLRTALQSLAKEYENLDGLRGEVESVFVLTYADSQKNNVSDLLHGFEDTIKTEMHHHHSGTCIDILNLETDADTTRKFFSAVKSNKSIYSVTYSIVSEKGRRS